MSRLFVSPRDAQFISDTTKELMRDVVGASVSYYRVRQDLTTAHDVYNEASEIVYDDPIKVDCFVNPGETEATTGKLGIQKRRTLTLHFHTEDLFDRDLNIREGDLVSWGDHFYEIEEVVEERELWGLVEFEIGFRCTATQVQSGRIQALYPGPVARQNTDFDGLDGSGWTQSRGRDEYANGQPTQDRRWAIEKDQVDVPDKQMGQSVLGETGSRRQQASFYDEFDLPVKPKR